MINLTETLYPQPTLSLYLGGTGVLIGERLLVQLESLEPAERKWIEPFFIDSQEPKIIDHERARHYCYTDLDQFFQPIYQEFTDGRFPENLGASPVTNSSQGCGVTRIFGAASLVACRDDFMSLIEGAVGRLKTIRRTGTQPLQVFITASACGGTGAGMILDAAALVRHYFRSRHENPRIFLFLLGPAAYADDPQISIRDDQRDRMRASTYALLKELNHFADGNEFISAYRLRDQQIRISNRADDDRLFDWVYFIDGRGEQDDATRTLDEVIWTIAETQVHLAFTEVGRKVAESLPNQREERLRGFAQHFIHADHKERLDKAVHQRLETSSRRTFLASFAVRNVRFPSPEIKTYLRARWVRDAWRKTLHREDPANDVQAVEQFDEILGHSLGQLVPGGLLADLGLMTAQLWAEVSDTDERQRIPAPPPRLASPDRAIRDAEQLLTEAGSILEDLEGDSSVTSRTSANGRVPSIRTVVQRAIPRWTNLWEIGLAEGGKISERLLRLAWAPAGGRGLRFLEGLLFHTSKVLTQLAGRAKQRPSLAELETAKAELEEQLGVLRSKRRREQRGVQSMLRVLASRVIKQINADSKKVLEGTPMLIAKATALHQQILAARQRHLAAAIAPEAWSLASSHLKRWYDDVLQPTITAAENAHTLAENRCELARVALDHFQGVNARGDWIAHTTHQLFDDELLAALVSHMSKTTVEDLVLPPLQRSGISRETVRLTIHTLRTLDGETLVDMIAAYVETATRSRLEFLDNGWKIDAVRQQLRTNAARILDTGSEPLTSFSRTTLGVQLQSYFLVPRDLVLPKLFGRRLSRMNRLKSRDPLQLGVVSFAYGIPPNALVEMLQLFEQYTTHVGDRARNAPLDRFPLHVFRHASEYFDEPYSPLAFQANDGQMLQLVEAAHELWGVAIHLDIREFDPGDSTHLADWNRYVELTEKVLRHLTRSPGDAERFFEGGRYPDLQRLYASRRHRTPASSRSTGNEHGTS